MQLERTNKQERANVRERTSEIERAMKRRFYNTLRGGPLAVKVQAGVVTLPPTQNNDGACSRERAKKVERTRAWERATICERTKPYERAIDDERTKARERAKEQERTSIAERYKL